MTSGAFTTNNKPGAASTSAYGAWGNRIAGGYIDPGGGGIGHAYIYNQSTGVFTQYDAPAAPSTRTSRASPRAGAPASST